MSKYSSKTMLTAFLTLLVACGDGDLLPSTGEEEEEEIPERISPNIPENDIESDVEENRKTKELLAKDHLKYDDVLWIIEKNCGSSSCHGTDAAPSRRWTSGEKRLLEAWNLTPASRVRDGTMPRGTTIDADEEKLLLRYLDENKLSEDDVER